MEIRAIKTERDYRAALARIEALFDAEPDTPEGDELDVLALLVEAYEQRHFPIEAPDPVEFLLSVMEFRGVGQSALAEVLGSRPRASEILNRKRPLTLEQVRRITAAWQIPADPLVQAYPLKR